MPPEWLVAWAPVIGPIGTVLLALVAMRTARAASISAEMARKEFQVARRPFPYIRWDGARLTEIVTRDDEHGAGQAGVIVGGRVHEASGVPTTLHSARIRLLVGTRGVGSLEDPGPFQDVPFAQGALLFGEHMYYILHEVRPDLTINRVEYEDFARRSVPILIVEVELVVSGPKQPHETWHVVAWFTHSKHEKDGYLLSVRHFPSSHEHGSGRADDRDRVLLRPHVWST